MQLSGSEYMGRVLTSRSTKLRWAVHLAYLFDSEELTRGGAAHGSEIDGEDRGGETQRAAAAAGVIPWRDRLARWSLAGLFRELGFDREGQVGRRPAACVGQLTTALRLGGAK